MPATAVELGRALGRSAGLGIVKQVAVSFTASTGSGVRLLGAGSLAKVCLPIPLEVGVE